MVQQRESVLYFDGDADYISVADSEALRVTNYTVEFWAKADRFKSENSLCFMGKYNNGAYGHTTWINKEGTIKHWFHTTKDKYETLDSDENIFKWGKWQHLAFTNDGTTAKFYLNGELSKEMSTGAPLVADETNLIIGGILASSSSDQSFKGHMAEVRLWNNSRSQSQIKSHMFHRLLGDEDGLAGYWPLNDIANNTASDETDHENHGKVYGAVVDEQLPMMGSIGSGTDARQYVVKFDGSGDYVKVENPPCPTDAITVSCWAKSATSNWNGRAVLMCNVGSYILHTWEGSKKLRFYLKLDGLNVSVGPEVDLNNYDLTKWHHYAGTFDGRTIRFYVDGVEVTQEAHRGKISTGGKELIIGANDLGAINTPVQYDYFKGKITEAQVWDKALSAEEIKQNMLQRLKGDEAGLVGYWPLDKGHGDVATDETSNKKHGAIVNAVWDEQFPIGVVGDGQLGPGIGGDTKSGKPYQIQSTSGQVMTVFGDIDYDSADVRGKPSQGTKGQTWTITDEGILKNSLFNFSISESPAL